MAEHPIWNVGNRNPSITDTIVDSAGVAIDLTGSTVKFKARQVGTATLLVDAAVSNTPGADGVVRYDWSAADAATGILSAPRMALIWWEVTVGGKTQDVLEALIEVREHAPETNAYVELEEVKSSKELSGTSFADADVQLAIVAASRGIDRALNRRFYPDADAAQIRYYNPDTPGWLPVDDIITLTELATDSGGDGTFEDVWVVNTDFVLEPLNAVADGEPYRSIRRNPNSSLYFPCDYPRSVRVTGKFGWAAAPSEIKVAASIIASRLVRRTREAPHGLIALGLDGAVMRAASMVNDPELGFLLNHLSRNSMVA